MEENSSIQSRISALEQHLEDVRKRAKNLLIKDSSPSSQGSLSFSDKAPEENPLITEEPKSESDSFTSSEHESIPAPQQFFPSQIPMPNYYPMYYPQHDFRQQIDFLHYQLNQNQLIYASNEKKLKDDNAKIKEEMITAKEECKKLKEENTKLHEILEQKEKDVNEENSKQWKLAAEKYENNAKNLEAENKLLENRCYQLENKCQKMKNEKSKSNKPINDKPEDGQREEAYKNELKRYCEKIQALENKINSDKILIENFKKDLSKADDKIAHLEDSTIETRNNYSQINKKLSNENDYLKKQVLALTKANEIKDSDEISKLKLQIIHKNKEIESLKKELERSLDEEQPTPIEIKVSKRKSVPNPSQKLINIKKRQIKSPVKEEYEDLQYVEESEEFVEDYKAPSLENQLVHLQIEKQKLENEYIKLPEFSRNLASKLRRTEVETELESLTKTISCVKSKLRSLNLI
ncbi:hypothetical protein SteCoe_27451 [Stentor coeruleus]|uniref:Enkurin domain-containing protein n=1 Tax=Stentor coeruleus TaxID=5963 RepID=A0A1R2BAH2_9CILI|nr:hypothetical protein SteCoe_27451 [Stentor coeruleus]